MDQRDQEIVSTLTLKVPLLSVAQVARCWWSAAAPSRAAAERRVVQLAAAGWLERHAVTAPPELPLSVPLFLWNVGDAPPSFGAVAHRAARRLADGAEQQVVICATKKAAGIFGGHPGKVKLPSVPHDLHLGALYVRFCCERPEDAAAWVSEATLAPDRDEGHVLPDAALTNPDGSLRRVIEFVGRYRAERLERIHDDCEARGLPYELW